MLSYHFLSTLSFLLTSYFSYRFLLLRSLVSSNLSLLFSFLPHQPSLLSSLPHQPPTAMTICTMVCALLGLTSPSNRGGLLTTLLMLYIFMGSTAGFAAARIYKLFGGKQWKQNTVLTATVYPGKIHS